MVNLVIFVLIWSEQIDQSINEFLNDNNSK